MNTGIAGTILAGGLSQRLGGGDKGLLTLGGDRTVLDHAVARMAPQVQALALNANGDPNRFSHLGLTVFADDLADFPGPLAGILAAMDWAAGIGRDQVITVAGDTPFLPLDLADRLAEAASGKPGVIAVASSDGRRHPTSALWPVDLRHALRRAITDDDERRVTAFIGRHSSIDVEFPFTDIGGVQVDPFFNVNTPADLAEARRIASSMEP